MSNTLSTPPSIFTLDLDRLVLRLEAGQLSRNAIDSVRREGLDGPSLEQLTEPELRELLHFTIGDVAKLRVARKAAKEAAPTAPVPRTTNAKPGFEATVRRGDDAAAAAYPVVGDDSADDEGSFDGAASYPVVEDDSSSDGEDALLGSLPALVSVVHLEQEEVGPCTYYFVVEHPLVDGTNIPPGQQIYAYGPHTDAQITSAGDGMLDKNPLWYHPSWQTHGVALQSPEGMSCFLSSLMVLRTHVGSRQSDLRALLGTLARLNFFPAALGALARLLRLQRCTYASRQLIAQECFALMRRILPRSVADRTVFEFSNQVWAALLNRIAEDSDADLVPKVEAEQLVCSRTSVCIRSPMRLCSNNNLIDAASVPTGDDLAVPDPRLSCFMYHHQRLCDQADPVAAAARAQAKADAKSITDTVERERRKGTSKHSFSIQLQLINGAKHALHVEGGDTVCQLKLKAHLVHKTPVSVRLLYKGVHLKDATQSLGEAGIVRNSVVTLVPEAHDSIGDAPFALLLQVSTQLQMHVVPGLSVGHLAKEPKKSAYLVVTAPLSLKRAVKPCLTRNAAGLVCVCVGIQKGSESKVDFSSPVVLDAAPASAAGASPSSSGGASPSAAVLVGPEVKHDSCEDTQVVAKALLAAGKLADVQLDTRPAEEIIMVCVDKSTSMILAAFGGNEVATSQELSRLDQAKVCFHTLCDRMESFELPVAIGLMEFSSACEVVTMPTKSFDMFHDLLDGLEADGRTSLYDCVTVACDKLLAYRRANQSTCADNVRLRVLMLTDGDDSSSYGSMEDAIVKLRTNDIICDGIALCHEGSRELRQLTYASGGQCYNPSSAQQCMEVCQFDTLLSIKERYVTKAPKLWKSAARSAHFDATAGPDAPRRADWNAEAVPCQQAHHVIDAHARAPAASTYGSGTRVARVMLELKRVYRQRHAGYTVYPGEGNVCVWRVVIRGPTRISGSEEASLYEGGAWMLSVVFPHRYPDEAPVVHFDAETPIRHVNVSASGKICHSILHRNYAPRIHMDEILNAVYGLLLQPEVDDPLDVVLAETYHTKPDEYTRTIRAHVGRYGRHSPEALRDHILDQKPL